MIRNIISAVPQWITHAFISITADDSSIYVNHENITQMLYFLKNNSQTQFKVLIDITVVDYPTNKNRFKVVYHLLSIRYNTRIRLYTVIDQFTQIQSCTNIYPAANWFEREVWDLFGVFFTNHPDLRRILTDYGFKGHPLRKDFPLSGYTEVRYDYSEKRVITVPVELTQEYRVFDFQSPWQQIQQNH